MIFHCLLVAIIYIEKSSLFLTNALFKLMCLLTITTLRTSLCLCFFSSSLTMIFLGIVFFIFTLFKVLTTFKIQFSPILKTIWAMSLQILLSHYLSPLQVSNCTYAGPLYCLSYICYSLCHIFYYIFLYIIHPYAQNQKILKGKKQVIELWLNSPQFPPLFNLDLLIPGCLTSSLNAFKHFFFLVLNFV